MTTTPRGLALLRDPQLNKSTAFTESEREALGLLGLLPEGIDSEETQIQRVQLQLSQKPNALEKYIYLSRLQDADETLSYRLLMSDPAQFLPIVYTPTVGEACLQFGHIHAPRPRASTFRSSARAACARFCATGRVATCASSWSPAGSESSGSAISAPTAWASPSASWRFTPHAPACRRSSRCRC